MQVDVRNSSNQTCLHIASTYGHLGCVRELLEAGANVEAVDQESQWTPLHRAFGTTASIVSPSINVISFLKSVQCDDRGLKKNNVEWWILSVVKLCRHLEGSPSEQ